MIDRRRHHAHTAAAHGPLRARRAGGRRLSRMRHWKGHVPCSAVGAGECGGWHTPTARAVCARRRSQESAARRLSLHGPCWGSGGLAQAPETGLNSKLSNSDDTYGSTDLRLPTVDTTTMRTDPERLLSPGPGWYSTRVFPVYFYFRDPAAARRPLKEFQAAVLWRPAHFRRATRWIEGVPT